MVASLAWPQAVSAQKFTLPPGAKAYTMAVEGPLTRFNFEGDWTCFEQSFFKAPELAGKKIYAMEVWGCLNPDGTPWNEDQVYNQAIFYNLSTDPEADENGMKNCAIRDNGVMYGVFESGFTVPATGFFAGYWWDEWGEEDGEIVENPFAGCANGVGTPGGLWAAKYPMPYTDLSNKYGPAPIKLYYCDEPPTVTYDVSITPVPDVTVAVNQATTVSAQVVNDSWADVKNYTYTVFIDGQAYGEPITLKYNKDWYDATFSSGLSMETSVELPGFEAGNHTIVVTVTKVNGADNTSAKKSATFAVRATDEKVTCPDNCIRASLVAGEKSGNVGVGLVHVETCIRYDASMFKGLKVVGAEIRGLRTSGLSGISLWHRATLEGDNTEEIGALQTGDYAAVIFKNPVEITDDGPYFGCSFNVVGGDMWPIPVGGPKNEPDGCWGKYSDGWHDLNSYGSLMMTLYVESANIPENAVKIGKNIPPTVFESNKSYSPQFYAINLGKSAVTNVGYAINSDELQTDGAADLTPALPAIYGAQQTMCLQMPPMDYTGDIAGTFTIPVVNGQENALTSVGSPFRFRYVSHKATKRPLFEEYTGVSCGWCPKGIVAMKVMGEKYPDFIPAVYHLYFRDAMTPDDVDLPWDSESAPDANIDRTGSVDPFYGSSSSLNMGIEVNYQEACDNPAPADIEIKSDWNAETNTLKVHSLTNFSFLEKGKTYKLGYILTANKLQGEGNAWKQLNFFAGDQAYADNPYLKGLVDGTFDLSVFHDIVLTGSKPEGVDGSLPEKLVENFNYADTISFYLGDNDLVNGPENVSVIAILIDSNGIVRNARKVAAGQATMEGNFPEPGDYPIPEEPAAETIISYEPSMDNWNSTSGENFVPGQTVSVAIALNDEMMTKYKNYQVIGFRAYGFEEGKELSYVNVKMFCLPDYKLGTEMNASKALETGIVKNAYMKDQVIEFMLEKPFILTAGNPMFGYTLGFSEPCDHPCPIAVGSSETGALYLANNDEPFVPNSEAKAYISILAKDPGSIGIKEIPVYLNQGEVYYDLMGRRVLNPERGVFIKKSGNVTTKVVK